MTRNIYIIGAQCTGKTTLILQLEQLLSNNDEIATPPVIIHEVVREVMSTIHFSAEDFGTKRWIELQQCTIIAQVGAEEAIQGQWFISDRSVLDPIVYAQLCGDHVCKLRETEGYRASVQRMREGLVILCEAGQKAWLSSDGVRVKLDDFQQWEAMTKQFEDLLTQEDISYQKLSKRLMSIEERAEFVIAHLHR